MKQNTEESDDNIISNTPIETLPETSSRTNRPKKIYNKNNINNLVYYPGELLRPKHPCAFKTRNYDSKQVEVCFLRMICEITALQNNEKFRLVNIRTVGTYHIFNSFNHLKDNVTGHRIELDFSCQFYDKMPPIFSSIMIMGSIKHKSHFNDGEQIFAPYILVKTWEEWTGKINFHEFYYNARRYRSPQVDETIPIEEEETSSDDMLSGDEDFEKTEFFVNLKKEGLLDDSTFVVPNNCSMSAQDFEKTEFLNNIEKNELISETKNCEEKTKNCEQTKNCEETNNYDDETLNNSNETLFDESGTV